MHCTRHRVFLATLIVAAKYLNDSSPRNKHWTKYCGLFAIDEVNLMEKQLLYLLDYDLRVHEHELLEHFSPFLAGHAEDRATRGRRQMTLRSCEAGRECERYERASQRRIYLRSLPAEEVPCWNAHKTARVPSTSSAAPSIARPPTNAPPSPVSPAPVAQRRTASAMMSRQQSHESTGSSASSEAELTDDNGSSSSSAEDEYDDDEEEDFDEMAGEDHYMDTNEVQHGAQAGYGLENDIVQSTKAVPAMHRYIQSAIPAGLRKSASGMPDMSALQAQQQQQSHVIRASRSSGNLLARMLGHQSSSY